MLKWLKKSFFLNSMDLSKFDDKTILIVGDAFLDIYKKGISTRLSPEFPVPVVNKIKEEIYLGGSLNVARNIKSIGFDVNTLFVTGNDKYSKNFNSLLADENISYKNIIDSISPSIRKERIISNKHQVVRLDYEEKFSSFDKDKFLESYIEFIQTSDLVILSDYNKGTLKYIEDLIMIANDNNKPIMIDPKGKNFKKYKNANVITPNLEEFYEVVGICNDENEIVSKAYELKKNLDIEYLVITMSDKGIMVVKDGSYKIYDVDPINVVDVTGAGDIVISILSIMTLINERIDKAAILANTLASKSVKKFGTSIITKNEFIEEYKKLNN